MFFSSSCSIILLQHVLKLSYQFIYFILFCQSIHTVNVQFNTLLSAYASILQSFFPFCTTKGLIILIVEPNLLHRLDATYSVLFTNQTLSPYSCFVLRLGQSFGRAFVFNCNNVELLFPSEF